jgi:aminopeptidase N
LHETGHEWFGNAITASDLADIWLQEGITTYGEALYMEKKYGHQEGFFHLILYRLMIKNKYPIVGPMGRRYFDYKDGDVYTKGAWTMHSLRNVISNDTLFFRIIRTFYEENKLKTTSSGKFTETVNRITGKDYGWFFEQYLYQRKAPVFEYQYTSDGGIYYRWANVSEGFNQMQVSLKFEYIDNLVLLKPSVKVQKFMLPQGQKIYGIKSFGNDKMLFGTNENKKLRKIFLHQLTSKG